MDINNSSHITNAVASSLSKLNLSTSSRAQKPVFEEKEVEKIDIKEEDAKLMDAKEIKSSINVAEIQQYATRMGETLSIEDINYGLMYGRSVIADYSV